MTPPDATPFVRPLADRAVSVVCPPKINLTLSVGPPRPDGLHPIASLMLGLGPGFADELVLIAKDNGPSAFEVVFHPDAPGEQQVDWPLASDLAFRAHGLMQQRVGRELSISARLVKRIPTGSGLGGGSADAAGMLVGLNQLYDLGLPTDQLVELGGQLGSDVSFAVHVQLGRPAAWVTGIGDQIEPVHPTDRLTLLLIFPPATCPTARVYQQFDALGGGGGFDPNARPWTGPRPTLAGITPHNDLAAAAFLVAPPVKVAYDIAADLGGRPQVTGSGSALFAVCRSTGEAEALARRLKEHGLATRTAAF